MTPITAVRSNSKICDPRLTRGRAAITRRFPSQAEAVLCYDRDVHYGHRLRLTAAVKILLSLLFIRSGLELVSATPAAAAAPPKPLRSDGTGPSPSRAWVATLGETFGSASPETLLAVAQKVPAPKQARRVVLLEERRDTLGDDGRLSQTVRSIYRINSRAGAQALGTFSTTWVPWLEAQPKVEIRVVSPTGQVRTLNPETIEVSGVPAGASGANVLDDTKRLRAPLPHLQVGSVVEQSVKTTESPYWRGAGFSRIWSLGGPDKTVVSRLSIDLPAGTPLHAHLLNAPHATMTKTRKGPRVKVSFEAWDISPLEMPAPHLPPDVVPLPAAVYSTTPSWARVAASYGQIVDRQLANDTTSKRLAALALKDAAPHRKGKAPLAIANLMLKTLHAHVRYTGVEFAEAAIVPRPPATVLERGFGDCGIKPRCWWVCCARSESTPALRCCVRVTAWMSWRPYRPHKCSTTPSWSYRVPNPFGLTLQRYMHKPEHCLEWTLTAGP